MVLLWAWGYIPNSLMFEWLSAGSRALAPVVTLSLLWILTVATPLLLSVDFAVEASAGLPSCGQPAFSTSTLGELILSLTLCARSGQRFKVRGF